MSQDYIIRNRGYVTASKLKEFQKSPEAYFLKYVLEQEFDEVEEKDAFILGRAFDDFFTFKQDWKIWESVYFCDEGHTVADLTRICYDRQMPVPNKVSKDELIRMVYGDISKKTRLTDGMAKKVKGMIREAQRQTLWDLNGEYEVQKEIKAVYQRPGVNYKLNLKSTLDRAWLANKLIRDYKTTNKLDSFATDLHSKFGYDFSMGFYHTITEATEGVQCDMLLDVVQSTYPYPSKVFCYPKERLQIISVGTIIPLLDQLLAMHELYETNKDPDVWRVKSCVREDLFYSDSYPFLEGTIQKEIEYINF